MSILSVHNLSMSFIERNLFTDVSFDIEARDKVGFIGANGVGKTTIFKIINGQMAPTAGSVFISKDINVGYMEQHACTHPNRSVYEELLTVFEHLMKMEATLEHLAHQIEKGADNLDELIAQQAVVLEQYQHGGGLVYKSKTRATLLGLGFSEADFDAPTGRLSGGQRSKLSLAKLLLSNAGILLLDEPTNHLDINSVAWLEGFIKEFSGAVLIISHDRYFLDAVTNKTIELENQKITCYLGNYSEFVQKKQAVTEALENKYKNDLKEIKRIEGIVEQQKRWGQAHNFITAESKQKQANRLKEQLVAPEDELDSIKFSFEPQRESGNDVLIIKNLAKSFGEKKLFENANLHIRKGEKVFIIGSNGCGKTTLFKILTGEHMADCGEISFGAKVDVGYFDQMQGNLCLEKTALDQVWDVFPKMTQTQVRTALGSFLFKGDEVFKPLSKMSGGERARISLLMLMLSGDNFLLLDEPTNHLDTASREKLEDTLKSYPGTMLIVSHDRYFINKLADKIIALTPSKMEEYLGNYDYYLEKSKASTGADEPVKSQQKPQSAKQNEYKLKKEQQSQERKRQTQLKKAEEQIEQLDLEISKVEQLLQNDEVMADYEKIMELTAQLDNLNQQQSQAYELWDCLSNED